MKNILKSLLLFIICITLSGCFYYRKNETSHVSGAISDVDYEKYDYFVGIDWARENNGVKEHLKFYSDGRISYSDSNGNPINNSDICTKYYYNVSSKTIGLICYEEARGPVKDIVIKDYNSNSIALDFNGDIRIFTKK